MEKGKIKIIMKNGKEYLVMIPVKGNININELLTKNIFPNYNKNNDLNLNTFDLAEQKENMNSVVINLSEISSIEYNGIM